MSSGWFHVSLTGANIYAAANPPLRSGSPKRTKGSIATARHLCLDFDIDGEVRLTSLRASDTVPAPTAVLSTSLVKFQIFWRVDGFSFAQQKSALKLLTIAFGSDPACTDCNRIVYQPRFTEWRVRSGVSVTVEFPWDAARNPDDFWLDISATNAMLSSRPIRLRKHPGKYTNSEQGLGVGSAGVCPRKWWGGAVGREACSRGGDHGFCASGEGMILPSISWRCQNGASHRKNFETPPLRGCCRASRDALERLVRNE
jgi:RepB DNA-primase from phage plasmid